MPYITKKQLEELTQDEKEKELEKRKLIKSKVLYYIDELSILFVTIVAVIFSDAITKRAKGELASLTDIALDWLNLSISALLALVTYGTLFTKFKYNDKAKPPYLKRLANSILNGIAWRAIIGYTE